jgi:hypothetical protein
MVKKGGRAEGQKRSEKEVENPQTEQEQDRKEKRNEERARRVDTSWNEQSLII